MPKIKLDLSNKNNVVRTPALPITAVVEPDKQRERGDDNEQTEEEWIDIEHKEKNKEKQMALKQKKQLKEDKRVRRQAEKAMLRAGMRADRVKEEKRVKKQAKKEEREEAEKSMILKQEKAEKKQADKEERELQAEAEEEEEYRQAKARRTQRAKTWINKTTDKREVHRRHELTDEQAMAEIMPCPAGFDWHKTMDGRGWQCFGAFHLLKNEDVQDYKDGRNFSHDDNVQNWLELAGIDINDPFTFAFGPKIMYDQQKADPTGLKRPLVLRTLLNHPGHLFYPGQSAGLFAGQLGHFYGGL